MLRSFVCERKNMNPVYLGFEAPTTLSIFSPGPKELHILETCLSQVLLHFEKGVSIPAGVFTSILIANMAPFGRPCSLFIHNVVANHDQAARERERDKPF